MKKKLTLSIDESVTRRAKRLAQREGTSVSEIVEKYLAEKTAEESGWKPEEDSWTARLLGAVPQSQENYKEIKEEEILKKYGG
jgi:hypothetical protein